MSRQIWTVLCTCGKANVAATKITLSTQVLLKVTIAVTGCARSLAEDTFVGGHGSDDFQEWSTPYSLHVLSRKTCLPQMGKLSCLGQVHTGARHNR